MRLVVGVLLSVLVLAGCGGSSSGSGSGAAPSEAGAVRLVYRGEPTAQAPVITSAVLDQTRGIISSRLNALGLSSGSAVRVAGGRIVVDLPLAKVPTPVDRARAEGIVGTTGRMEFYDWEANALTPKGKTVASLEQLQDVSALTIGQGVTTPAGGGRAG